MFLDIPIELQHGIYDRLDVKSRVKLNIAMSKHLQIHITNVNNPNKDRKLRWLLAAVKHRKYISLSEIGPNWQEFIIAHYDDPTIMDIMGDSDDFRNKAILQRAIETNAVCVYQKYNIDILHWQKSLFYWLGCIAKCANAATFENIAKNETTKSIIDAIKNVDDNSYCKNFFSGIMFNRNRSLLQHIVGTYKHIGWVATGIETISNMMDIMYAYDVVQMVCELLPDIMSLEKKRRLMRLALHAGCIDTVEYLMNAHGVTI